MRGARDRDALLLADAEPGYGTLDRRAVEAEPRQQAQRLGSCAAHGLDPRAALRREPQGQGHVVDEPEIGHQVEHLEDDAGVLGSEPIARLRRRARRGRCRARAPRHDCAVIVPQTRPSMVDLPDPDGPTRSVRVPISRTMWATWSENASARGAPERPCRSQQNRASAMASAGARALRAVCGRLASLRPVLVHLGSVKELETRTTARPRSIDRSGRPPRPCLRQPDRDAVSGRRRAAIRDPRRLAGVVRPLVRSAAMTCAAFLAGKTSWVIVRVSSSLTDPRT